MTEEEWITSDDPERMLKFLYERGTDRQYRLFAVACARDELEHARKTGRCFNFGEEPREIEKMFWDPVRGYEAAILGAEAWADGRGIAYTWSSHWFVGWGKGIDGVKDIAYAALGHDPDGLVAIPPAQIADTIRGYQTNPAHYLRDIFGNPFRPVAFDPEWRTSTVVAVARGMYENRDFSPIPLLADALQDTGCENETILNHCRSAGSHVRGCWVLEMILGKTEGHTPSAVSDPEPAPRKRPWWKFW